MTAAPEPSLTIDPTRVKRFRDALEELGYDGLLRGVRGSYPLTPFPPYQEFRRRARALPERERTWFELLLLGRALPAEAAAEQLGAPLCADLLALGVLRAQARRLRTPSLGLTSYQGRYALGSLPPDYPTQKDRQLRAYIGLETYLLASFLPPARVPRALDLCSGSGLLGILLASTADSVLAADIDPVSVSVGSFNVELNGLSGVVETRQGDLWEAVPDAPRFDLIAFNAPFVPTPEGYPGILYRDGGPDGLRVLSPILEGLSDHLAPRGTAVAILEAFGDQRQPFLVPYLEEVARRHGLAIDLLLLFRFAMSRVLRSNRNRAIPRPAYRRLAEEQGATRYYRAVLRARPGSPAVRVFDVGRYVK